MKMQKKYLKLINCFGNFNSLHVISKLAKKNSLVYKTKLF